MRAVAIDGPAGAGKSTIARRAAQALGFLYVDTGALYRTIGYAVDHFGLSTRKAEDVAAALDRIRIDLRFLDGEQRVFLNGEDVTGRIRTPEVSMFASEVSAVPQVRQFLLALQRELAQKHDVIMDGRDIGTVVLPGADLKIFLTATAEDRARRRYRQLQESGTEVDFDRLLAEIRQRDYNDSHRAAAPLRQAEDAVFVDTTGNTLEESVALLEQLIRDRLGLGAAE